MTLSRYRIHRGARPAGDPLPEGVRLDTRKHVKRSPVRPTPEIVGDYLRDPGDAAWKTFRREYLRILDARHAANPQPFDALAELARTRDVHLGCNCPTAANPDPTRCHTHLALGWMAKRYPALAVVDPVAGVKP